MKRYLTNLTLGALSLTIATFLSLLAPPALAEVVAPPGARVDPPAATIPAATDAGALADEIARLRAGQDALRAEVEALRSQLGGAAPASARSAPTVQSVIVRNEDYTVGANEVVGGALRSVSGDLKVLGEVRGDVSTVSGDVDVEGAIQGNLTTVSGDLSLGPSAVVSGDVRTVAGSIHRAEGARVGGVLQGRAASAVGEARSAVESALFRSAMPFWAVLTFLFVGMVLLVAMPRRMDTVGRAFVNRPGETFVLGLLSLPLAALAALLTALTIIGPFVVAAGYVVAFVMGVCAMALMLGRRLVVGKRYRSRFFPLVVGLTVWYLATAVSQAATPLLILVTVSTFIAYSMAIGAALTTGFGRSPYWLRDRMAGRPAIPTYADPYTVDSI